MAEKPEQQTPFSELSPLQKALRLLARLWRRVENVVFGIVLLLVIFYFVLQTPLVQNWLIHKITGYLSDDLQTTVSISHVDISFFDNLILEDFFVADRQGDTLLYAEKLSAGLNSNIFSLLSNKLEFNDIGLTKARFNIRRAEGQAENNLQFILDYFTGEKKRPPTEPKPFRVRVQNLRLTDVEFLEDDAVRGRRLRFYIPSSVVRINNLDLPSKIVDVQSAIFDGVSFDLAQMQGKPLTMAEEPAKVLVSNAADTMFNLPPRVPLRITIAHFELKDSHFGLDKFTSSPSKQTAPDVMDYNHMQVQNIDFKADSLYFDDNLNLRGQLLHFAAHEQSGFVLSHAEAKQLIVSDTLAALYGTKIQTPGSTLSDTIAFHYERYADFKKFNSRINMEGRFAPGSRLRLGDISYFSGSIARNSFFLKNKDRIADIMGSVDGRVNRLRGRNLDIRLSNTTRVRGKFNGDDLAEGRDRMRLEFIFDEAYTNLGTIRDMIPGFSAPAYFDRLGSVGFTGTYQLLFGYNHILNGKLNTAIGSGQIDMELDLTHGRERATYSGDLNMQRFDLGAWTGNKDFGKTTFHVKIADGSTGLTLPTIRAKVAGVVDTLPFKGYNYHNIRLDGAFNAQVFDGKLSVEEDNLNFAFEGFVSLKDTTPEYSFTADVRKINLGALHLVKEDWVLSAKVDRFSLRYRSMTDFEGRIRVRNLSLLEDRETLYALDSLTLISEKKGGGERYFLLTSDLGNGTLSGNFNPATIGRNLLQIFSRHYPELASRLGAPPIDSSIILSDNYQFSIQITDTRNWTRLIDARLDTIRGLSLLGQVDAAKGRTQLNIDLPKITYAGIALEKVSFEWQNLRANGNYDLLIPATRFSPKRVLAPVRLSGSTENDAITFHLESKDTTAFLKGVNLNGVLSAYDTLWQIKFNASNLALFNEEWYMDEDNYLRFGRGYLSAQNFDLMNAKNQRILIDTFNQEKGLSLAFTNFDVSFFNQFYTVKNISYHGKIYDFDVKVEDIYHLRGLSAYLTTDSIFLNGHSYGDLTGNVDMADLHSPLEWKVFLRGKEHQLRVVGAWMASGSPAPEDNQRKRPGASGPAKDEEQDVPEVVAKPGEFQTHITATNFPLDILERFIPGITYTSGTFNADLKLGGPPGRIGMQGQARILTGEFVLDYLKSLYHIKNQVITLTDYKVWADGDTISDASTVNLATIKGGLRHDHFRDWQLDCTITSKGNNFLVLNTLATDNPLYYGQATGRFAARFTGSFSRTNIQIDAVTGRETRLYIPLSSISDIKEVNFIHFTNKQKDTTATKTPTAPLRSASGFRLTDLKGLNFEMNITVTEDAEVQLIFDEQAGDIIKGRGTGDITLSINREGEFKMYGNYTITRGEYLFTLLNFVNKPFTVSEGGTILWSGDPYRAEINLEATYTESTSLYNLLRDELLLTGAQDLAADASKPTDVVVTMYLKGDLLKPTISFDLDFPNLSSRLKSLVDNKLRLLRQDQNELNRQVFGVVVVGSFLPSNTAGFIGNEDYAASAVNTVTQMFTNQFSNYLTALAAEWFGGTVSSIDFNIAYNEYRSVLADQSDPTLAQTGRELQLRLTSGFVNDRITVQLGSQFGLGRPGANVQDGFLGEDVTLEFQLTANRQWRLKVYQRTEPDIAGGQLRARYGFGISFRKDYDNFAEMLEDVSEWFRKKKKQ